jgi:predicted nucleotidyltransferase
LDKEINNRLDAIEEREGVRILYACESGSRAWGFPSADSDYDVRLIYVRPREWYLRLDSEACRDVIEEPIEDVLDINGWDLKKALQLLKKSNPVLMEWLQSPVVYREDPSFKGVMGELMATYCSPGACYHHYSSMARSNFREHLKGEEVKTKKYFYVLRPVLAMIWIERGMGIVPMEFENLVDKILEDGMLKKDIQKLITEKRDGLESERGPRIGSISNFIENELSRLEKYSPEFPGGKEGFEELNRFFLSYLE